MVTKQVVPGCHIHRTQRQAVAFPNVPPPAQQLVYRDILALDVGIPSSHQSEQTVKMFGPLLKAFGVAVSTLSSGREFPKLILGSTNKSFILSGLNLIFPLDDPKGILQFCEGEKKFSQSRFSMLCDILHSSIQRVFFHCCSFRNSVQFLEFRS